MPDLTTDRLLLRSWRESDRDPWAEMVADPEVMEFFPAPLNREEADAAFAALAAALDERGWGRWAVELHGQFVGFIGLSPVTFDVPFRGSTEVAWRLARRAWGHGYATEGARAALAFAFDELGLDEVISFTAVINERSQRVMQRLGMTRTGEFEHPAVPEGHDLRPHVLYRLPRNAPA